MLLNLASNAYDLSKKGTVTTTARKAQENSPDLVTIADAVALNAGDGILAPGIA